MSDPSPHPTREELGAYSLGQLPQKRADAIDSHISECQPCCETIAGISSDDTFVGLLKEARQLPTDQTVDHGSAPASSSDQDVPAPLAEHPRYEILTLIGKGGMGDVYRATHRMMKRTVALKIIKPELMRKPEAVDRFHREVTTAAQLSHPNIVTAYDAEQAGDVHFLVMEYVDGTDLSQLVKDRGALPIPDACDYVRQAAIGLQHAHEQGMVHRDIKPHNLMVLADGTVKILDFGLASLAPEAIADADTAEGRGDLTAAGTIMGTPDFISPEQAEDARSADIRSDIYSLGATLYFLLSGRPLFADGSVMHKLKSHATAEPDPLRTLRDDVPSELESIIARMTAKDPVERFQSPNDVAVALEPFVRDQERESAAPTPDAQLPPRRGPFSWLTAVAAGFAALLLAAAVYFVVTDNGVVRVEVFDDSLDVSIDGGEITLDEDGKKRLVVRRGEHELVVRVGDTELITDEFEMRRSGEIIFRVKVEEGLVVVSRKGQRPKTAMLPGASDRVQWPELRITNDGVESTGLGRVNRSWKLRGRKVGIVTARLVHVSDGKMQITGERKVDLSNVTGETVGQLSLATVDRPQDRVALSIEVEFDGVAESPASLKQKPLVVDKGLGSSSITKTAQWDGYGLDANEVVLVHWHARLPKAFENLRHGDDLNSMVEASKQGASFVVVTLEWDDRDGPVTNGKPVGPLVRPGSESAVGEHTDASAVPTDKSDTGEPEATSDHAAIQGTWRLESTNGKPPQREDPGFEAGIVFGEKTLEGIDATLAPPAPFTIDSTKTPKQIDIRPSDEPPMLGIYELDADTLRIGFSAEEGKRPTSFAKSFLVLTLKWNPEASDGRDNSREASPGGVPGVDPSIRLGSAPIRFGGQITALEYSRDGKRLLSVGDGWGAAVWDAESGDLIRHVPDGWKYTSADLSADGTLVVTSGYEATTVRVRNIETGEVVRSIEGESRVVRFAPDGKSLFTNHDHTVTRFDLSSGEKGPMIAEYGGGSYMFAVAPTGTLVAGMASGNNLRVWDWQAAKEVARGRGVRISFPGTKSIVFTPDGESVLVLGERNGGAELRDARTLEVTKEFPGDEENESLCLNVSADGRRMAFGSNGGLVFVYDLKTGQLIKSWRAHTRHVSAIALSPDGSELACGTRFNGSVRIWNVDTLKPRFSIDDRDGAVGVIAVLPDGKTLISQNDRRRFDRWNLVNGKRTHSWWWTGLQKDHDEWALCSKTGRILSGGASLTLTTDPTAPEPYVRVTTKANLPNKGETIFAVALSADGQFAAAATKDARVCVCDLEAFSHVRTVTLPMAAPIDFGARARVALSADGGLLAGSLKNEVRLWDVKTGRELAAPDVDEEVTHLAFSPDGTRLALASRKQVVVHDVQRNKKVTTITDDIGSIVFSPDGRILATGAHEDSHVVRLWETNSGRETRQVRGALGGATSLAFSPDGEWLYAGTGSSQIVGWKLSEMRNITCSNGIVHVIDAVLLPSDVRADVSPHWKDGELNDPVSVYAIAKRTMRTPVVKLAPNLEFASDEFQFEIEDYPQMKLRANAEILEGWPTNIELTYRRRDDYRGPLPEAHLLHAVHWVFVDTDGKRHELAGGHGGGVSTFGSVKSGRVTLFSNEVLKEGHFEITFYETLLTKARWRDEWRTPIAMSNGAGDLIPAARLPKAQTQLP